LIRLVMFKCQVTGNGSTKSESKSLPNSLLCEKLPKRYIPGEHPYKLDGGTGRTF